MTDKQKKKYESLTKKQKRIYDSVMDNFPASSHETALNIAIQGGIKFQFIPK